MPGNVRADLRHRLLTGCVFFGLGPRAACVERVPRRSLVRAGVRAVAMLAEALAHLHFLVPDGLEPINQKVFRSLHPRAANHKIAAVKVLQLEIFSARDGAVVVLESCEKGGSGFRSNCLLCLFKSAGIGCMAKRKHESQIFAVIQFGGTQDEQYLHSFSTKRHATEYMKRAQRASYRCFGPFSILLEAEGNLARVVGETIEWLRVQGFESNQHTLDLERALDEVRKDLDFD